MLRNSLTELFDYPKFSSLFRVGSRYLSFFNTGLQPQSVLYVQETLNSEKRVLLDLNLRSKDGTVSLNTYGCGCSRVAGLRLAGTRVRRKRIDCMRGRRKRADGTRVSCVHVHCARPQRVPALSRCPPALR